MSNVHIKFIFPNHDGVNVLMSTNKEAKGIELKDHLINNWPSGKFAICSIVAVVFSIYVVISALQPCTDKTRIRLICMGIGILEDSTQLGC